MARQRTGPEHDITKEGIYIPGADSAWLREKIDAEVAALRKGTNFENAGRIPTEDDPAFEHTFWRYVRGCTRFDIEAEGLSDYIDMAQEPEMWRLRRLSGRDRARVLRACRQDARDGFMLAFTLVVAGLDNAQGEEAKEVARLLEARSSGSTRKGRAVTDDALLAAVDALDAACGFGAGDTAQDVGAAALTFSGALTEEEKKA